ncbi:hypothetical protein Aduo_006305 [Ancylostoma duodenale]
MVVDDYGRGLPAGFLLAKRMDKEECVYFFQEVKKVYKEFMPRFFLSDDTNTFWNGWVKSLLTQTNKVEFSRGESELLTLLHKWRAEKNQSAEKFHLYFCKQYLNREEQWGPYKRTAAIANTSMVSERWHRTLKYTLLNRSANHRADELVHTLLAAIPELAREHLVQEGKFRAKENARRHRKAVEEQKKIKLTRVGSKEWLIGSFAVPGRQYRITADQCSCENTKMYFSLCGVCPVAVKCSCPDAVKSGIASKHAHAWALFHNDEADFVAASEKQAVAKLQELTDRISTL